MPQAMGTTIPHSDFNNPDCCGCLVAFIKNGIAMFTCNECSAVIACCREDNLNHVIHELQLSAPWIVEICPYCQHTQLFNGLSSVSAYVCERCGKGVSP